MRVITKKRVWNMFLICVGVSSLWGSYDTLFEAYLSTFPQVESVSTSEKMALMRMNYIGDLSEEALCVIDAAEELDIEWKSFIELTSNSSATELGSEICAKRRALWLAIFASIFGILIFVYGVYSAVKDMLNSSKEFYRG